jgi:uncharacterized protein (DUF885 family)
MKSPSHFAATHLICAISVACSTASPVKAQLSSSREAARLAQVFADDARRDDALNPLATLYRGKSIDPASIAEIFTDQLDRRTLSSAQLSLRALGRINPAKLETERRISFDVFQRAKLEQQAWSRPDMLALTAVRPFNHFGGLHVEFPTLVASGGVVPYTNRDEYRRGLGMQLAFAQVLDNAVMQFRRGMRTGVVETQLTVRNMIGQIDALLAQPVEQSPFYSPVLNFPQTMDAGTQDSLRLAYQDTIRMRVLPAYSRLRTFLVDEYLPVARASVGLSEMKGGAGLYRKLIERETTLKMEPETVHQLGLSEVARIKREMESVQAELGYTGTLQNFFNTIRTAPAFHPKSKEELSDGFRSIGREIDAQIPRYFSRTPKTPLLIEPYPAYREKYEAGGSYNQGSPDGSRPGTFYFNTYDLPSRFISGITTLYLHEGSPGHHFQISLAQEDKSLPDFQRFDGNNAFVEGWALYAETLGYDMGLYKDPKQHWGTLDDEMLRAMRLVVDTGLHAKGWSREKAIDYMLANSGMGRTDAVSEVERYIANPAQALSYKIGALTIQRLRKTSEAALGAKFDIRAFHEQVLGSGALPLPVLEAKINRWIAEQKA